MSRLLPALCVLCSLCCFQVQAMKCDDLLVSGPLPIREIYRIKEANAVTAPAFAQGRHGEIYFAFANDTGKIQIYGLNSGPVPVWTFPLDLGPINHGTFTGLKWHTGSSDTPILFVYWGFGGRHPRGNLFYRAVARLFDQRAYFEDIDLPPAGSVQAVHSLNFNQEFLQWVPDEDATLRLIDFNKPGNLINIPEGFSAASMDTAENEVATLIRPHHGKLQILIYNVEARAWLPVWEYHCRSVCMASAMTVTQYGDIWVAHTNVQDQLIVQGVRREDSHRTLQIPKAALGTPLFFENALGTLFTLINIGGPKKPPSYILHARKGDLLPYTISGRPPNLENGVGILADPIGGQTFISLPTSHGLEFYALGNGDLVAQLPLNLAENGSFFNANHSQFFGHADLAPGGDVRIFSFHNP